MSDFDSTTSDLSPYELLRLEKIRRNEAYLDALGLTSWAVKAKDSTMKTNRNKKRAKAYHQRVNAGEERRSERISKKGVSDKDLLMLAYTDDDKLEVAVSQADKNVRVSKKPFVSSRQDIVGQDSSSSSRPSRAFQQVKRSISLDNQDFRLTEEEKAALSQNTMDDRMLGKFEEFLVYHNKISDQNRRNVLRQVKKLARGEGINYDSPKYGWKPDQFFMKGQKINILSDFVDLLRQGKECEEEWGPDHGNGWLLSHPLKKLLLFQQFCLQNPDFLASESPLGEYYANDDAESDEQESSMSSQDSSNSDSDATNAERSKPKAERPSKKKARIIDMKNDPRGLVGKRVAKEFNDGQIYLGTVSKYDAKSRWWTIVYDDSDREDMDADELRTAVTLYETSGQDHESGSLS